MQGRIETSTMTPLDDGMSRYRAILTDTDRDHISGESEPSQEQKDQAVYRARQRITEELPHDIEILAEHRPDVLKELREVVCDAE